MPCLFIHSKGHCAWEQVQHHVPCWVLKHGCSALGFSQGCPGNIGACRQNRGQAQPQPRDKSTDSFQAWKGRTVGNLGASVRLRLLQSFMPHKRRSRIHGDLAWLPGHFSTSQVHEARPGACSVSHHRKDKTGEMTTGNQSFKHGLLALGLGLLYLHRGLSGYSPPTRQALRGSHSAAVCRDACSITRRSPLPKDQALRIATAQVRLLGQDQQRP